MPPVGSKFEFQFAIDEISKLTESVHSGAHFNIFWITTAKKKDGCFSVDIECARPGQKTAWSVNVKYWIYLTNVKKSTEVWREGSTVFSLGQSSRLPVKSEALEEFNASHVINDSTTLRFVFEVSNPTGFQLPQWNFSLSDGSSLSDVVLKVENREFHVSRMLLANFSDYFHKMFFSEKFEESKKKEIVLKEVNPANFQALLDVIYHKSDVSILNVRDILEVVNYFDVPDVKRKCEELLLSLADTVVSRSEKILLADKFILPKLLEQCVKSLTSVSDVCSVTPKNVRELSENTIAELLQKVVNLHKT